MRLLMLTPYLPYPPSSGGHIRSYNLIKHLSTKHKIVLVALIKNDEEKEYIKQLEKYCEKIYVCKRPKSPWTFSNITKSVFGPYPLVVVRNYSVEASALIKKLLKEEHFDLIHAETFYIMPHIPPTNVPILLVEQTIEYLVYETFVKSLKNPLLYPLMLDVIKLKYWEKMFWKKADLVATVSENDREKILAMLPDIKVEIVPNAAGEDLIDLFRKEKNISNPVFFFQGNFSWLQNVEAATILARDIFPRIKQNLPKASCLIAGQNAHIKIAELKKYGVQVEDMTSNDIQGVRDAYKKATVFIAPIEGPGGTRLKILGAMAAGIPVISSKIGITGLAVKDKRDVLIADSIDSYVKKSILILSDKKLYQTIRVNARKLIETTYNWKQIAENLEDIYRKLKDRKI